MTAVLPPFRLLSPEQFALLTAEEKSDYLSRLSFDVQRYIREFRERNKRLAHWVMHKDDVGSGK